MYTTRSYKYGRVEDFLTSLAGIRGTWIRLYLRISRRSFLPTWRRSFREGQLRPVSAQDLGTPHYGLYSRATTFWASSRRIQSLHREHQAAKCTGHLVNNISIECSVANPWHFGVDPDPDQRIHASASWIRILLFLSLRTLQDTNKKLKI